MEKSGMNKENSKLKLLKILVSENIGSILIENYL